MIEEIIKLLEAKADNKIKKRYINNGVNNTVIGTNYSDIKKISKHYKNDTELAVKLYNSDIYECMYLSKYIIDKKELDKDLILDWVLKSKNFKQ